MRTLLSVLTTTIGICVILTCGIASTVLLSIMFIPALWTGKDCAIEVVKGIKNLWKEIYKSVREILD